MHIFLLRHKTNYVFCVCAYALKGFLFLFCFDFLFAVWFNYTILIRIGLEMVALNFCCCIFFILQFTKMKLNLLRRNVVWCNASQWIEVGCAQTVKTSPKTINQCQRKPNQHYCLVKQTIYCLKRKKKKKTPTTAKAKNEKPVITLAKNLNLNQTLRNLPDNMSSIQCSSWCCRYQRWFLVCIMSMTIIIVCLLNVNTSCVMIIATVANGVTAFIDMDFLLLVCIWYTRHIDWNGKITLFIL